MGKNLRGRELGTGLTQRKDGYYSAKFLSKSGKRVEKYFKKLVDAREWLEKAKKKDGNDIVLAPFDKVAMGIIENDDPITVLSDMTVDQWFEFWTKNIVNDLSPNTIRNYRERYEINCKPLIGKLKVGDVKPLHCKVIFNSMMEDYAGSTIRQCYIAIGTMFRSAINNVIIDKHPLDGVRYTKPVKPPNKIKFLTVEEQEKFLKAAETTHNYKQFAFLLETGLRTGELIGLTWDAVDFENRTLTINKTLEYRYKNKEWRAAPPKTVASYRTIPLTTKAYDILKELYDNRDKVKQNPELDQELEFMDRQTAKMTKMNMKDIVFLNWRTGLPTKNSSYDTFLYKVCDKAGIKRFTMHSLRHTYATRAIERGVNPKTLQELLGHASIMTTMNTYVHVSDDSKLLAIRQFEQKAE